jgi:polyisoprenoid-binding protein YceI
VPVSGVFVDPCPFQGEEVKLPFCRSLLVLCLPVQAAPAIQVPLDRGAATVEFVAVGWPSALEIHGKGKGLHGRIAVAGSSAQGRVSFDLQTLDTGIGLRNRHMKEEYLETTRFPQATLTLTRVDVQDLAGQPAFSGRRVPFEGLLELHGVSRPVSGEAQVTRDGSGVKVEAAFGVRTTDFGIRTPSYLGITVAEEVKVKVRFSAPVEGAPHAAPGR